MMMRSLVSLAAICVVSLASNSFAAPPAVRPMDVATLHLLAETACEIARDLREVNPARKRLRATTIVIDPGHGGHNEGAIGVAQIHEKRLTLELAYALRDAIEARYPDTRVLLTRYWDRDVDLEQRIRWANALRADLFLSLHYNAATHDRAVGYETYYLSEEVMAQAAEAGTRRGQKATAAQKRAFRAMDASRVRAHVAAHKPLIKPHERSKVLAETVQTHLAKRLESVDRGVKQANFAVLRGARMPAVVVEAGFLTHPEEGVAVLTRSHLDAVVASLVEAIAAFDKTLPAPRITRTALTKL